MSAARMPPNLLASRITTIVVPTKHPALSLTSSATESFDPPTRRVADDRFDIFRRATLQQLWVRHEVVDRSKFRPDISVARFRLGRMSIGLDGFDAIVAHRAVDDACARNTRDTEAGCHAEGGQPAQRNPHNGTDTGDGGA